MQPAGSDSGPEAYSRRDDMEIPLKKRASRQRRGMILLALWILTWMTLMGEGAIRYTNFNEVIKGYAIFTLITSVPFLSIFGGAALFGRWVGGFKWFRPHGYGIAFVPPLIISLVVLIPPLVTRLDPSRRFEALTGVELPAGASVVRYESLRQGIDASAHFHIDGPAEAKARIEKHLEPIAGDQSGVWIACETDKSGTLVVSYVWY